MIEKALAELTLNITDGKHGDCRGKDDSGYYFISCKDIREGQIHYEDARQIIEEDFWDTHKRTRLEPDDILVTNSGTIGRMAFVRDVPLTYRTTFQKSVAIVKPDKAKIFPKYLYYQLQNCVDDFINRSNGAAQKNLLLSTMRAFKMNIHEDEDLQMHIAAILSAYDDLIENNQKQIKLLEEAAQRLYKEWFVDLRFPGHETTPIVDGIPQGWERMVLSEVTSVLKRGISPKYSDNGKYSVINQKCIRSSIMDISESRQQEKEYAPTLNLQDSDTVICSTGTGTLGRVGRVYGDYPNTTFDSHVTLVRAKENPNYIYHVVKSQQEYLMGMGRGSTNQQELYRDVIERLVVLCPSQDILLKADRVLNAIHCKIKAVYLQNNLLVESRDRLLPKLMSGEIEV